MVRTADLIAIGWCFVRCFFSGHEHYFRFHELALAARRAAVRPRQFVHAAICPRGSSPTRQFATRQIAGVRARIDCRTLVDKRWAQSQLNKAASEAGLVKREASIKLQLRRANKDRVTFVTTALDAAEGVDALTIVTEWSEFRNPDLDGLKVTMREPVIFDGRNILAPEVVHESGFEYYGVGRLAVREST